MTSKSITPFAVVMCDDIRREDNGKALLIGVYSGAILVPAFPAFLQVAVWINAEIAKIGSYDFEYEIFVEGTDSRGSVDFNFTARTTDNAALPIPAFALTLTEGGTIEARWRERGEEWETLLRKDVRQLAESDAILRPS